jgi:hypothetical protein
MDKIDVADENGSRPNEVEVKKGTVTDGFDN